MELKKIIKETILEEKDLRLENYLQELKDIRDDSYRNQRLLEISVKLINEGFNIEDFAKDFKNANWSGAFKESMLSGVREYIIRYVIKEIFGANSDISTTAAQILADYSPLDLLRPFKNHESCMSSNGMPKLVDVLLEVLVRKFGSKVLNTDRNDYGINLKSAGTTLAGNIFGEAIRQSNISEIISDKFCRLIH